MESFLHLFAHYQRCPKKFVGSSFKNIAFMQVRIFLLELLWAATRRTNGGQKIADQLAVEAPSITRTVQRMARQGLVRNIPILPTPARSL